jgi:2-polyprenyl-3-methyl-5-hydroxy-6-metoxy-1,4-benzoquinol methylase
MEIVHELPYNEAKALQSRGGSNDAIYTMVANAIQTKSRPGETLVDVGCGTGALKAHIDPLHLNYIGVDIAKYDGFPSDASFQRADLETQSTGLPDCVADIVVAVEVIEHLENPRAFFRELARIAKPGSYIAVTTPNQLSCLSLLTLLMKQRFSAFQDVHYPAHLTALLGVDLLRIATESGLVNPRINYSKSGRLILTSKHFPHAVCNLFPRLLSDNVLLISQKPPLT